MSGSTAPPDYLVIGHLTHDLVRGEKRPGGTALYAAVTAARLGRRVAIATSFSEEFSLPAVLNGGAIQVVPSDRTTTYAIDPSPNGRALRLLQRADAIRPDHLPAAWKKCPVTHLAPVADEVAASIVDALDAQWLFATPQGWLRDFGEDGLVRPNPARLELLPLERFAGLVLSIEDVADDRGVVARIASRAAVVVLTEGQRGCTVYEHGRAIEVSAFPVAEVDSTGAGDVFAAAFFVLLSESASALESARFAACAAALSVRAYGATAIPERSEVEGRLRSGDRGVAQ